MNPGPGLRRLVVGAALVSVPLATAATALAAGNVALVNHLAGYALYTSGADTSQAHAFMIVRAGDLFEVPAGVLLKVVYLKAGRQETFSGPASFVVGVRQSTVRKGPQPRVSALPTDVSQRLSQAPELMHIAKLGRAGGTIARGNPGEPRLTPQQQAEVRQARETYATLRAETAADDITPELYLYTVLQDNLLFEEMKLLVAEMSRRQPNNADIAILRDYVNLKAEQK